MPTKAPDTSPPTRFGETNPPSHHPTSNPTYDLNAYKVEPIWLKFAEQRALLGADDFNIVFANFFYKGIDFNIQRLEVPIKSEGVLYSDWPDYAENRLSLSFSNLYFSTLSVQIVRDNFLQSYNQSVTAVCRDRTAIKNIINLVKGGIDGTQVCGGNVFRVYTCGTSSPLLCVNCNYGKNTPICKPCQHDSLTTYGYQTCTQPKSHFAQSVIVNFRVALEIFYPEFRAPLQISTFTNFIAVAFNVTVPGNIYCAAYDLVSNGEMIQRKNVFSIKRQVNGVSVAILADQLAGSLTISNLSPETEYSVYCYTESFGGDAMSWALALQAMKPARTHCCRAVVLQQTYPQIVEYQSDTIAVLANTLFKFSLDSQPVTSVLTTVTLQKATCSRTNTTDTTDTSVAIAKPSTFSFSASSLSLSGTFMVQGKPGCYKILVNATGDGRIFKNDSTPVEVRSIRAPPLAPVLLKAQFSNDGVKVVLTFDSSTNGAGLPAQFACKKLLIFRNVDTTICLWTSSSSISFVAPVSIKVNDSVTMLGNMVKPACTQSANCKGYPFSERQYVSIENADSPVTPTASLSASGVVSSCDPIVIDPTGSTGSAGRDWLTAVWSVTGPNDPSLSNITERLNKKPGTDSLVTIENTMLIKGNSYSFSLLLQNFLGRTNVGTVQVLVSSSSTIPRVAINAPNILALTRNQSVSVLAVASVPSCTGDAPKGLNYDWKLFLGFVYQPIESVSLDKRNFGLRPYSLTPAKSYTLQVTVWPSNAAKTELNSASNTITLSVGVGEVAAVISGGNVEIQFYLFPDNGHLHQAKHTTKY